MSNQVPTRLDLAIEPRRMSKCQQARDLLVNLKTLQRQLQEYRVSSIEYGVWKKEVKLFEDILHTKYQIRDTIKELYILFPNVTIREARLILGERRLIIKKRLPFLPRKITRREVIDHARNGHHLIIDDRPIDIESLILEFGGLSPRIRYAGKNGRWYWQWLKFFP